MCVFGFFLKKKKEMNNLEKKTCLLFLPLPPPQKAQPKDLNHEVNHNISQCPLTQEGKKI